MAVDVSRNSDSEHGSHGREFHRYRMGDRVLCKKMTKHPEREGTCAVLMHCPVDTHSWFKLRFEDGVVLRQRATGFRPAPLPDAKSESLDIEFDSKTTDTNVDSLFNGENSVTSEENSCFETTPSSHNAISGTDEAKATTDDDPEFSTAMKNSNSNPKLLVRLTSSMSNCDSASSAGDGLTSKPEMSVGSRIIVRETNNVRSRARHMIGKTGTIKEVPVHPNTWFRIEMDCDPSQNIKFQGTALVLLDANGDPIEPLDSINPVTEKAMEMDDPENSFDGPGSASGPLRWKNRRKRAKSFRFQSSKVLLSDTDPLLWIGLPAILKGGSSAGEAATIVKTGNGWVQLRNEAGDEFARRAYELYVPRDSPLLDENGNPLPRREFGDDFNSMMLDGRNMAEVDIDRKGEVFRRSGGDPASAVEDGSRMHAMNYMDYYDEDTDENDGSHSFLSRRARRGFANRNNGSDFEDDSFPAGRRSARIRAAASNGDSGCSDSEDNFSERIPRGKREATVGYGKASRSQQEGWNKNASDGRKNKGALLPSSPLAGCHVVVTNGLYKGIVGVIKSGNGYFYINTMENQRVRKKREQFEVLELIDGIIDRIAKRKSLDPLQLRKARALIDGIEQDVSLHSYSSNYVAYSSCSGKTNSTRLFCCEYDHVTDVDDDVHRELMVRVSQNNRKTMRRYARGQRRDIYSGGYDSMGLRRDDMDEDMEDGYTDDEERSGLGNGGDLKRQQRAARRAAATRGDVGSRTNGSRQGPRSGPRLPFPDHPCIERLLQANKDRQELVLTWLTYFQEKMLRYNSHRPNLKFWLDRIQGNDEDEDTYMPPFVKIAVCSVCRLEKNEKFSSCWNPACWRSPVYDRCAVPLDKANKALPLSPGTSQRNYAYASLQSPRKPGFIEVCEADFPFVTTAHVDRLSEAMEETARKRPRPEKESSSDDILPDNIKGSSASSSNAELQSTSTSERLENCWRKSFKAPFTVGWGRFVAGRMREEEETIASPLLSFEYRAKSYTLGRKPHSDNRFVNRVLSGYFVPMWTNGVPGLNSGAIRDQANGENSPLAESSGNIVDGQGRSENVARRKLSKEEKEDDFGSDADDIEDEEQTGLDFRWHQRIGFSSSTDTPTNSALNRVAALMEALNKFPAESTSLDLINSHNLNLQTIGSPKKFDENNANRLGLEKSESGRASDEKKDGKTRERVSESESHAIDMKNSAPATGSKGNDAHPPADDGDSSESVTDTRQRVPKKRKLGVSSVSKVGNGANDRKDNENVVSGSRRFEPEQSLQNSGNDSKASMLFAGSPSSTNPNLRVSTGLHDRTSPSITPAIDSRQGLDFFGGPGHDNSLSNLLSRNFAESYLQNVQNAQPHLMQMQRLPDHLLQAFPSIPPTFPQQQQHSLFVGGNNVQSRFGGLGLDFHQLQNPNPLLLAQLLEQLQQQTQQQHFQYQNRQD